MNLKSLLLILSGVMVGLFVGLVIGQSLKDRDIFQQPPSINNQPSDQTNKWLDLPLEYFSKGDVQWGSGGSGDKITDYSQAAIRNIAIYQSYPSLIPTVEVYENKNVPLKNLTSAQIKQEISKIEDYGQPRVEDSFKKFGTLVSNYIPERYIWKIEKFDVDGDGISESIVSTNYSGAATGGSYNSDIIKGNNIIFSINEDNSIISPADTTNGFFVEWGAVGDPNGGRCCEEGIKRTRFVYKDNKFIPIYEQEIMYLKIGKE